MRKLFGILVALVGMMGLLVSASEVSSQETAPTAPSKKQESSAKNKDIAVLMGDSCSAESAPVSGDAYTLRISFVEGSSESVCDIELKIRNMKSKILYQDKVKSPWIYLNLPAGGYDITAKKPSGEIKNLSTQTASGKLQKARIYFSGK